MSIFTSLLGDYGLEHAFRDKDCTTPAMKAAISEWFALYYERKATAENDPCQRIAYTVVNKLTKTCFSEYTATSKDEFAQSVLDALNKGKEEVFQTLLIGGETFIKPVPVNGGWKFNAVRRDSMLVFGRDVFGVPNDIGTIERSAQGRYFYTLLERRRVEPDGRLTITNTLYRADEPDQLGSKTTLQALPQYADLAPEYTYPTPLGGIGLVHMRVPTENTVDGSEDGVSVFAPAVGLIHNIDRNEAQINGEFERGKSKVFASADLMRRGPDGKLHFAEDVFVGLDDAPDEVGIW